MNVLPLTDGAAGGLFWHATPSASDAAGDRGTEVFLTLADRAGPPQVPPDWTLHVDVTCGNRDLPGRLPFGGGQPRLQLGQGGAAVGRVDCLTAPTPTARPPRTPDAVWRLVSLVTLNPLSVSGGPAGAAALREVLAAGAPADNADARATIDAVVAVDSKRVTAWAGGALCRGVELTVTADPVKSAGGGLFLFLTVLDRFLGLYSSLNSFTRLVAVRAGRDGVYHRWPARTGDRPLI